MKTFNQIREGDVLLVAVDRDMPLNLTPKTEVILAKGEITGHAHRLRASTVYEWEENGQRYVRVVGEIGTISHEDHDLIPVPVITPDQTYRVIPQQEWNIKNQWKRVVD